MSQSQQLYISQELFEDGDFYAAAALHLFAAADRSDLSTQSIAEICDGDKESTIGDDIKIMCNIISGSQYSKKGKLSQCCCGCSLRAGTLTIGWFLLISSIFWIIDGARAGAGGGGGGGGGHSVSYGGIGSLIITILSAIFILIGVYKSKIRLVWVSVYLMIVGTIWDLIMTILFFLVGEVWIVGVVVAALALLNLYFVLVVRSYAYAAEVAVPSGNPA